MQLRDSLIARVRGLLLEPKDELPQDDRRAGRLQVASPLRARARWRSGALARFVSAGIIGAVRRRRRSCSAWRSAAAGSARRSPRWSAPSSRSASASAAGGSSPSSRTRWRRRSARARTSRRAYKVAAWIATPIWVAGALAVLGSVPYLDWLATHRRARRAGLRRAHRDVGATAAPGHARAQGRRATSSPPWASLLAVAAVVGFVDCSAW